MRFRSSSWVVMCILAGTGCFAQVLKTPAERPVQAPVAPGQRANSEPNYLALRNGGLSGESSAVNNLVLQRDAGTFTFKSGTFYWTAPVNGKVTMAVFAGDATFALAPSGAAENRMLGILTHNQPYLETFSSAAFFFTDGTYDEIKKTAGNNPGQASGGGVLSGARDSFRGTIRYNIAARLLQDVLSPEPGGFFASMIHGKNYGDKTLFILDPNGVDISSEWVRNAKNIVFLPPLRPDKEALITYSEDTFGVWYASAFSGEYARFAVQDTELNGAIHAAHQKIETTVEKNGKLEGKATTTLVAQKDGVRIAPMLLYPTLRVESVTSLSGEPLNFIQEDQLEDANFAVILPQTLKKGESYSFTTVYQGKDAIEHTGDGNYMPGARDSWFPNTYFGDYATYELDFRIPKKMKMVATGNLLRETDEGDWNLSSWKADTPQAVAGFNFGKFKEVQAKLDKQGYTVQSFANEVQPDWVKSLTKAAQGETQDINSRFALHGTEAALGTMDTTDLNKKALAEAQLAMQVYSDYFGPATYKTVAVTQQTACTFGQSWPGLVFLPICSFFDTSVRHQLGLDYRDRGYWKVVNPHEVAHQWWGHTVGFDSYRDQWMSEGFADFSASIFLQQVYKGDQYQQFLKDEREVLLEKNRFGFRAIDAGPVTLGYRLTNPRLGDVTRELIYPKGFYILHMIRMMMWDNKRGDQDFKAMMRDFVSTYHDRPATTEDFKAMVEKHINPQIDVAGNRKMDWFFNPWVYGTALPHYHFEQSISQDANGAVLNFKIVQSNVDNTFAMPVPVYLELTDGRVFRLGAATLHGNTSVEQHVPLGKAKPAPKRAILNYYSDVLSAQD